MTSPARLAKAPARELQQALIRASEACERAAVSLETLSNAIFDLRRAATPEGHMRTLPATRNATFSALCEFTGEITAATRLATSVELDGWGEVPTIEPAVSRIAWLVALGAVDFRELEDDARWIRGFARQLGDLAREAGR